MIGLTSQIGSFAHSGPIKTRPEWGPPGTGGCGCAGCGENEEYGALWAPMVPRCASGKNDARGWASMRQGVISEKPVVAELETWPRNPEPLRWGEDESDTFSYLFPLPDMMEDGWLKVDIFVSAGESNSTGTCYPGGDPDLGDRNCSLYRIRMGLKYASVIEVEEVMSPIQDDSGQLGIVQAALSPDGDRLAFLAKNNQKTRLEGFNLNSRCKTTLVEESDTKLRPQFPNWYSQGLLLYHAGEPQERTLYSMQITGDPMVGTGPWGLLGPAGLRDDDWSFADVNTARDGSGKVVTFGASKGGNDPLKPMVYTVLGLNKEYFELGQKSDGNGSVNECHHPAWNPSGDTISCSEQESVEEINGIRYRFLYDYQFDGTNWVQKGLSVDVSNRPFTDAGCTLYTYKYAEWCGSDNYMVATFYCENEQSKTTIRSRTYLIRRNPYRITDLTAIIEAYLGRTFNSLDSMYTTCKIVRRP